MDECSSWRASESEAELVNRDEERSEGRKRGKRKRRKEGGVGRGAGVGGSPFPACTSFISLIKAGAVGDVKNEPKDMGIGDRG